MFSEFISNGFKYLRKRYNSFENSFQLAGAIIGFILSIVLIATGVALIPFTGGASLLPMWLGCIIFVGIFTTAFLAAGRMLGIMFDTVLDIYHGRKINNEKLATAVACCFALILAAVAWPLHFLYIPYVVSSAVLPIWEAFLIFIPILISIIAAVGRHIGRAIDRQVRQKGNIYDFFKKIYDYGKKGYVSLIGEENIDQELQIISSTLKINEAVAKAIEGIKEYQELDGSHLGVLVTLFDPDTGKERADTYYWLLNNHKSVTTDLQKAIIIYAMLAHDYGPTLNQKVRNKMGNEMVVELDKYIDANVAPKARRFMEEKIVTPLSLFAGYSKRFDKDGEMKDKYHEIVNHLNDGRFCGNESFLIQ